MSTIKIRELRQEKGLTIKDLSENLNIKEPTLSKYERSEREPNIDSLIKIADYFEVSVDYLIGRSDCKKQDYQPIADLLGIDDKTIEILLSLVKTESQIKEMDILEAIIQNRFFPNLINQIYSFIINDERGWKDVNIYNKDGTIANIITAEIMRASSMQIIQNTFKGIVEGIPYSKHFL